MAHSTRTLSAGAQSPRAALRACTIAVLSMALLAPVWPVQAADAASPPVVAPGDAHSQVGVQEGGFPDFPEDAVPSPSDRVMVPVDDLMISKVGLDQGFGSSTHRWATPEADLTGFASAGQEGADGTRPDFTAFRETAAGRLLDPHADRTLSLRHTKAGDAGLWQLASTDAAAESSWAGKTRRAVDPEAGHTYTIVSQSGGAGAPGSLSQPAGAPAIGAPVTAEPGSSLRQQWTLLPVGEGQFQLANASDGLCVTDASGATAVSQDCQGAARGKPRATWTFEEGKGIASGRYAVRNVATGRLLGPGGTMRDSDASILGALWQLDESVAPGGVVPTWSVPADADPAAGSALAVGDLDGAVGEDRQFHDEAVVAFVESDHQVQLRVIDYNADGSRLRESGLTFRAVAGGVVAGKWRTGSLGVAIGDFTGDGGHEAMITWQDGQGRILGTLVGYAANGSERTLEVLRGEQVLVDAAPGAVLPSIVTGMVNVAAGDLDGTGRDEMAVAYGAGKGLPLSSGFDGYDPRLAVLQLGPTGDVVGRSVEEDTFAKVNAERYPLAMVVEADTPWVSRGPELVTGLFDYDPQSGRSMQRRQPAVAWSTIDLLRGTAYTYIAMFNVDAAGGAANPVISAVHPADEVRRHPARSESAWQLVGTTPLSLAAGNLTGEMDGTVPEWDLALAGNAFADERGTETADLQIFELSEASLRQTYRTSDVLAAGRVWTYQVTAYDRTGRSLQLGAPYRISTSKVTRAAVIAAQPPVHADWIGDEFVNVSRNSEVELSLGSSAETATKETTKSSVATSWGVSAELDLGASFTAGIPKKEYVKAGIDVSSKIASEWEQEQELWGSFERTTSNAIEQTASDDDIVDVIQQPFTLYRYPSWAPRGHQRTSAPGAAASTRSSCRASRSGSRAAERTGTGTSRRGRTATRCPTPP